MVNDVDNHMNLKPGRYYATRIADYIHIEEWADTEWLQGTFLTGVKAGQTTLWRKNGDFLLDEICSENDIIRELSIDEVVQSGPQYAVWN